MEKEIIGRLTAFDLDKDFQSLRITFNIDKDDIPDLIASRMIVTGKYFIIRESIND